MANNSNRLMALDILRGITVAGMLLVNNPGSWGSLYAPLGHAEWIGLTPTDLVFPFFIFCMGVAMFFSLKKFNFTMSKTLAVKMVRRTVLLFIIGWAVQWFSHLMYGMFRDGKSFVDAANNLDSLRILGVFQRLALVYFFGTLCATMVKQRFIPWLIGGILAVYALILGIGHGYDFSTDNIIAVIDNAVLGPDHMYHEGYNGMSVAFDPEGILSTLPCVAHVLVGFMVGSIITKVKENSARVGRLLLIGFSFILVGWLLNYGIPCGKKMWSSTFVLVTCGLAMSVLALLIYVIDMKGRDKWCRFFHAFGVNPLSLYVLGSLLAIVFGSVIICTSNDYVKGDAEKATAIYAKLATDSCAQAQNNLAIALYNGRGVEENKAEAVTLLKAAAADSSMVTARYNLALAYMQDDDAQNDKEILPLLTEAADSSITNAQYNLALCYDFGKFGIEADHAKAAQYYAEAAKHGLRRAQAALNMCFADTVGVTASLKYDDIVLTAMKGCPAFEGDSLTAVQTSFNEAITVASGAGERVSIKGKLYEMYKAITVSDKMASCLYAILFVLFNWIFGYILYKKKIIIKL
ncbi:MAG: hypothetical protein Q4B68_01850 [Bacteroidales bacterium]|nr:hypothetical protein [Bacteroidales bacterium]